MQEDDHHEKLDPGLLRILPPTYKDKTYTLLTKEQTEAAMNPGPDIIGEYLEMARRNGIDISKIAST